MAKAWQLLVQARGDSSGGQRAMRDLQKAGRRLSSAIGIDFRNVARMSALALGAGLAATVKVGFDELKESSAVTAQTVAGLKSTHGAANVTKTSILKLAAAVSKKSGIDDEAVQAGQNLLLTFTNIRNEAGRGNKIFDRSTQAVADLATKMNNGFVPSSEQMQKASIQVGKALNDPIKGVTALSKIGVSFTQAQKDQIKAMVESGDTMGAQKLILAELNKEFGGAAAAAGKTAPGAIARAKNAFAELAADLTASVMPSIAGVAEKALKLVTNVQAWTKTSAGKAALADARDVVRGLGTVIGVALKAVVAIAKKLYDWRAVLIPVAAGVLAMVAAMKAWRVATALVAVGQAALNVVLTANPIGVVVLAIVGLVAALVVAYRRSETFRNIVDSVWSVLKKLWGVLMDNKQILLGLLGPFGMVAAALVTAYKNSETFRDIVNGAFEMVQSTVSTALEAVRSVVESVWGYVKSYVTGVMTAVRGVVQTAMALLRGDWSAAWEGIKTILSGVWIAMKALVLGYTAPMRAAADAVWGAVKAALPTAWAAIKTVLSSAWDSLKTTVTGYKDDLVAAAGGVWNAVKAAIPAAWAAIKTAVVSAAGAIPAAVAGAVDGIIDKFSSIGSRAGSALASAIKSAINAIISKWNGLEFGGFSVGKGKLKVEIPSVGTPDIPLFARGGVTNRPGIFGDDGWEAAVPLGTGPRASRDRDRVMRQAGLAADGGNGLHLTMNFRSDPDPFVASRRMAFALQTAGLVGP